MLLEGKETVGSKIAKNFVGQGGWYTGRVVAYLKGKCKVFDYDCRAS